MRLTDDKVLLKEPDDTKTAGGIFLPSNAASIMREYIVVAVGPGRMNPYIGERVPMSVKVGDRVIVDKSVMAEVSIAKAGKKESYYLIAASNIETILEDDERF